MSWRAIASHQQANGPEGNPALELPTGRSVSSLYSWLNSSLSIPSLVLHLAPCTWVNSSQPSDHSPPRLNDMATQQKAPGGHYSGHNPIPTVRQFVENLDKDKKNRDAAIDAGGGPSTKGKTPAAATAPAQEGVEDHKIQKRTVEGTEKTVTDPTTGREVVISDVGPDMVNEVENPHVRSTHFTRERHSTDYYSSTSPMPTSTRTQYVGPVCVRYTKLTAASPSRQIPTSRSPTTRRPKMSQLLQTRSPKAQHPTYPSMARRPTFCSTPRPLSATSPCSQRWRSALAYSAREYSSLPLSLERCLVALSRA